MSYLAVSETTFTLKNVLQIGNFSLCYVNPTFAYFILTEKSDSWVFWKTASSQQNFCLYIILVAFLLAKRFSDLDNPDSLDFHASRRKQI